MAWARRNFDTAIVSEPDGTVHDQPAYPLTAFRELVANALVHRDLDHWSAGRAVEVRLRRDRLVISNPGGLYGITADRLGRESVTSARNARLVTICQYVHSPESGLRVIEALATGIPTVTAELQRAGLPPAHYIDTGIGFTVILRPSTRRSTPRPSLNSTELRVYDALADGQKTIAELQALLGIQPPTLRKAPAFSPAGPGSPAAQVLDWAQRASLPRRLPQRADGAAYRAGGAEVPAGRAGPPPTPSSASAPSCTACLVTRPSAGCCRTTRWTTSAGRYRARPPPSTPPSWPARTRSPNC